VLRLTISDSAGFGRKERKVIIPDIEFLRILVDSSLLEIYVNDGEYVITSRFYPAYTGDHQNLNVRFSCDLAAVTGWKMKTMETNMNLV
jgi:beta-fructofuranosidase